MAQDFYTLIASRRSIRKYKPDRVDEAALTRILDAARIAPSAGNHQPWYFVVIRDETVKNRLQEAYAKEWFYTAPVIICALGATSLSWTRKDGKDYRDVDVAIAFDHLVLAAAAEGLGTCWIGAFDPKAVIRILGIPEGVEPIALTPLGYPDEAPAAKPRKSAKETVRWEHW